MIKIKEIFSFSFKFIEKKILFILIFIVFIKLLVSFPIPIIQKYLIDNISTRNFEFLIQLGIIDFILSLLQIIISVIYNNKYSIFMQRSIFKLRLSLLQKIFKSKYSEIKKFNSSYLVNRAYGDSEQVQKFTLNCTLNIVSNIISFIYGTILILFISYQIAFIVSILIIVWIILHNIFKNLMYKSNLDLKEDSSNLYSKSNETINMIDIIKKNFSFKEEESKLYKLYNIMMKDYKKYISVFSIFTSISSSVNLIISSIILCFGVIQIYNNTLTLGDLLALNSAISFMVTPIQSFFSVFTEYTSCLVSYNRLKDLYKINEFDDGNKKIKNIISIEFKNIGFKYSNTDIFNNFSYKFTKGNTYVICGKNGSGKTTLINLMLRLYDKDSGNILINGKYNIEDIYIESYLNKIAVVEQEGRLFIDTIYNNIVYNIDDVQNDKIDDLISQVGLSDFISSLNYKLDEFVTENSANISGGQKQKISLCRALLRKSDVLILDEPTSALDSLSTQSLINLLDSLSKEKIIFIITHDEFIKKSYKNIIDLDSMHKFK